jgi:hypothetical protein
MARLNDCADIKYIKFSKLPSEAGMLPLSLLCDKIKE